MTGPTIAKAPTPLERAKEHKRAFCDLLDDTARAFADGRVDFERLAEVAIDFADSHRALVSAYREAEGRR